MLIKGKVQKAIRMPLIIKIVKAWVYNLRVQTVNKNKM